MNHPNREDWIPFIFGEASAEKRRELAQHLQACPDCAREISGWRRSLRRLDEWPLPGTASRRRIGWQPAFKWALAALLVLGVGFLAGTLTRPAQVDVARARAQMEASIRASLQGELNQSLRQFQAQTSNAFAQVEARLSSDQAIQTERVWRRCVEALDEVRAADAQRWQAALTQVQERSDAQSVAMRKDLETLASLTDDEIRQARLKLIQLASLRNSTE